MYLCLFTLYHVSAFMFTKIIKKGHYHDCDNGLVFLWTGLFAQPLLYNRFFYKKLNYSPSAELAASVDSAVCSVS